MARSEFRVAVRRAAWARCGGRCEGCGRSLDGVKFHYDHVIADGLGGQPVLSNCMVLCFEPCHRTKTAKNDVPKIAKVKRLQKRAAGIKKKTTIRSQGFRKPAQKYSNAQGKWIDK